MTTPQPKPPGHTRLVFSGILGTAAAPVERWSFRLNFRPPTDLANAQPMLVEATTAYTTHIAPLVRSNAVLTEVKMAAIDGTGLYSSDSVINAANVPGTGTGASNAYPFQIAMAVTLTTARRGPTGKGRIFLPSPPWLIDQTTGIISAANANTVAVGVANFLSALNGIAGLNGVVIASSKGYLTDVNGTRAGRALDTIRSRRTSVGESFVAQPQGVGASLS